MAQSETPHLTMELVVEKITRRRLAWLACLLVGAIGLWLALRHYVGLETLVAHERWLREAIDARPIRAFAISFVVYIVMSLIPGLAGKSVVFGWLLGFVQGLIVVNFGLTVAAIAGLLLSRYLLRDLVEEHLSWFMLRLRRRTRPVDSTFLLTLRLLHAPFSVVNYALGATDVSVKRFWWTTQLGVLPGNIAFVLAGASLPSLRQLQEQGIWSIVNLPLLAGLTAAGFAPIVVRWAVQRNLQAGQRRPPGTAGSRQREPESGTERSQSIEP